MWQYREPRNGNAGGSIYIVTKPPIRKKIKAPRPGLEPGTFRLTAGCSAIALSGNKKETGSAYKPRSVWRSRTWTIIFLERPLPAASSGLPGAFERAARRINPRPALTLLHLGVAWPAHCCTAGGLLRHLFTLTFSQRRFVSVTRSSRLLRSGCYPAGCSMERGLSSTLEDRDRPAGPIATKNQSVQNDFPALDLL